MISIALVQNAPVLEDKQANIHSIHSVLDSIKADITVFPELATSGYYYLSEQALKPHAMVWNQDKELLRLQERAVYEKRIICVGFPELSASGDGIYNSAALFMPNPHLSKVYRKTHLFYKEYMCFLPGNSGFFVIHDPEFDIRIGMMICYDWRFPESARTLGLLGADIILCPSNLVTELWRKVMPARAIENKVYLAVANRVGTEIQGDEQLIFKGESALYGMNGEILCTAGAELPEICTAMIDPVATRKKAFNSVNDIFADRRPEMYL